MDPNPADFGQLVDPTKVAEQARSSKCDVERRDGLLPTALGRNAVVTGEWAVRILFLSRWFPLPPDNGSKVRVRHLLQGLSEHHDVTLLSFTEGPQRDLSASEAEQLCSDVQTVAWRAFNPRSLRARLAFLKSSPRFLADTYSAEMDHLIRASVSRNKYDLVIASQLSMAAYYSSFQGLPALFEEIELGVFQGNAAYAESRYKRIRLGLTWFKLRVYLEQLLGAFGSITVASERERQLFLASFPEHARRVSVIPNCIAAAEYQTMDVKPAPRQIIFTGSFQYHANYEGMQWFVREVLPKIRCELPDASVIITGDHASMPLPPVQNVTLTGHVEDVKSLIASSRVSIVPLLIGGGTRLKILEAMALGTPVISTSKGAEGLDAVDGEHLLLADTPAAFADQVIRVLRGNDLHDKLSAQAHEFVKQKYDRDIVIPRFLQLVESAAS